MMGLHQDYLFNVNSITHFPLADVASILNTHRSNSSFTLDLGAEIMNADGTRIERGKGNVVSAGE